MHQLISDSENLTAVVLKITLVAYAARTHLNTKILNPHLKPKLIGHTLIARRLTEKAIYKYIYIYTHI